MSRKIERIAELQTPLRELYPAAPDATPAAQRINCTTGPNHRFKGVMLADAGGNRANERFEHLQLFQTADGSSFVAVHNWVSNRPGEVTMTRAAIVETVREAMDLWDWSTVAKRFAKELRWDVNLYIGERA